jgi:hypothetical protein
LNDEYPESERPWTFYFNGEVMPKWGACWPSKVMDFVPRSESYYADEEPGYLDIERFCCKIDHAGGYESDDPGRFIFAVQAVLLILLNHKEAVLKEIGEQAEEIYSGLVEAAFQMQALTVKHGYAFWTSGYEKDRLRLLDVIRRCHLPEDSPEYMLAPHLQRIESNIQSHTGRQVKELHELAQSGRFEKDLRRKLHMMTPLPRKRGQ